MMINPLMGLLMLSGLSWAAEDPAITPDQIPASADTGMLRVELSTDDSDKVDRSVEEVRLKVEEVQVHHVSQGWIRLSNRAQDIDLMAIREGQSKLLGSGKVYAETYDTLRLVVSDPRIMVNGREQPFRIEGGTGKARETLDFEQPFTVPKGGERTLDVELDLGSSLSMENGRWSLAFEVPANVKIDDDSDAD